MHVYADICRYMVIQIPDQLGEQNTVEITVEINQSELDSEWLSSRLTIKTSRSKTCQKTIFSIVETVFLCCSEVYACQHCWNSHRSVSCHLDSRQLHSGTYCKFISHSFLIVIVVVYIRFIWEKHQQTNCIALIIVTAVNIGVIIVYHGNANCLNPVQCATYQIQRIEKH